MTSLPKHKPPRDLNRVSYSELQRGSSSEVNSQSYNHYGEMGWEGESRSQQGTREWVRLKPLRQQVGGGEPTRQTELVGSVYLVRPQCSGSL